MRRSSCLFAALLMVAGYLGAQESRAAIQEIVTDPQGAAVPVANVSATNVETKTTVNLKTAANGRYIAPLLLPGNYTVIVEATGFKKEIRTSIVLLTADVRNVDFHLQVGAATESITVTGEAPLIDNSHTDTLTIAPCATSRHDRRHHQHDSVRPRRADR